MIRCLLCLTILLLAVSPAYGDGWEDHIPDIAIRLTQGGMGSNGPEGLGGGLLSLDVRLGETPLWVSVAGEYYKRGPQAREGWEIQDMGSLYLLAKSTYRGRAILHGGVGLGQLETGRKDEAIALSAVGGASLRLFSDFGLQVEGHHLRSRAERDDVRVVDFSNHGLLVGLIYDQSW